MEDQLLMSAKESRNQQSNLDDLIEKSLDLIKNKYLKPDKMKTKFIWILSLLSFAVLANTFIKDSVVVKAASVQEIQRRTEDKNNKSDYITVQDLRKYGRPDPCNFILNNEDVWHKENTYYAVDDYTGYIYKVTFYPTSDKIKSLTPVKKNNKRIKSETWKINNDDNDEDTKEQESYFDDLGEILGILFLIAPIIITILL